MSEITATIKDAIVLDDIIYGKVYGDTRGRFKDGEEIRSSRVIERMGDGLYKTKNSVYLVDFAPVEKKTPLTLAAFATELMGNFQHHLANIPLGEENESYGKSAYNWGQHYYDILRKEVDDLLAPQPAVVEGV